MEIRELFKQAKVNFSPTNVASVVKADLGEGSGTRSVFRRFLTFVRHIVLQSKNPWYYWYTGSKFVAIQAWLVSFCIMFAVAALASGGGLWKTLLYIFLGLALESLAIVVFLIALIADYHFPIPDWIYDDLILPVLISAVIAFVINRFSVFVVLHTRAGE